MAGRSDIQAGAAFVRLYVKNNELIKGLQNSGQMVTNWGNNISRVGGAISAIGGSITGALLAASQQFASSGDEINKMAQRTGASTEALSELRYAIGQSGGSVQDLEVGFKHMGKAIDEARQGSAGARETMARLGISMDDLNEPPDAQMELFAERLSGISDPAEKAALSLKVFGKSGTGLLPLFAGGAKGIRELRKEAAELGLTISQDQANDATNLGDAWGRVTSALGGATFAVGAALAPTLTDLLGIMKDGAVRLGNFVRENKELIITVAKAGLVISAIGFAILGIGAAFVFAGSVLTGLATVLTGIGTAIGTVIGILASGPGLLIAAIAGGVTAWATLTESGRAAMESITTWFGELLDIGASAWGGIADAIASGDLALAGQIAMAGLNAAWIMASSTFMSIWEESKAWFTSIWAEATAMLSSGFINAFFGIQSVWVTVTSAIESIFNQMLSNILSGWQSLQKGIGGAIIAAAESSGAVSKEFADAWRQSLETPINQDIAGRTAATSARQAEIETERQKAIQQINSDSTGANQIIADGKNASQKSAFDAALAASAGDNPSLKDATDKLAELRARAGGQRIAKGFTPISAGGTPEEIATPSVASKVSVGTFSAAAALSFGAGGSSQDKLVKNTEEQAKLAAKGLEVQAALLTAMLGIGRGLSHS